MSLVINQYKKQKETRICYYLLRVKKTLKRKRWTHVTTCSSFEEAAEYLYRINNNPYYEHYNSNTYNFCIVKMTGVNIIEELDKEQAMLLKIKHGI